MYTANPYPCVLVEWEDSAHYEAGWKWSDEIPEPTGQPCVTCGFLIKESERAYTVALSAGDVFSERPQFNGVMEIPKSCVSRFTSFSPDARLQIFRRERGHQESFLSAMRRKLERFLS